MNQDDIRSLFANINSAALANARSRPSPAEVIGKARRLVNDLGVLCQTLDEDALPNNPAIRGWMAGCEALATELRDALEESYNR